MTNLKHELLLIPSAPPWHRSSEEETASCRWSDSVTDRQKRGHLEDSAGVLRLHTRSATVGGALQVVLAMQTHICWQAVAHHHKSHLQQSP